MKRLLTGCISALGLCVGLCYADTDKQNNERPSGVSSNVEQVYWQGFREALQQFEAAHANRTMATDIAADQIQGAFANAAILEIISRAIYVREPRTRDQFIHDFEKAFKELAQNDSLQKELKRLMAVNIDPRWYLGRRATVEQLNVPHVQTIVSAVALNTMVIKQAQRLNRIMLAHIKELEGKNETGDVRTTIDIRLRQLHMLTQYTQQIMQASEAGIRSMLKLAQAEVADPLFNSYVQSIGQHIRYRIDDDYLEEMETVISVADMVTSAMALWKRKK